MVAEGHEQVDLPAGVAVHRVDLQGASSVLSLLIKQGTGALFSCTSHLFAARVVSQLIVRGMKWLAGIHWVEDHFIAHNHLKYTNAQDAAVLRLLLFDYTVVELRCLHWHGASRRAG